MSMRIRCWRFSCGTVRVHANTEPCTGDRGSKRASLFEFHISELPSSRQFMHRKPQRSQAVNHWQNGNLSQFKASLPYWKDGFVSPEAWKTGCVSPRLGA
ncbi:hypothetical protein AcV5_000957 [Taiwanofungus camphoratus]|nr:hypothetical protein AcV5_000957 [Antrodia cinnamomea]